MVHGAGLELHGEWELVLVVVFVSAALGSEPVADSGLAVAVSELATEVVTAAAAATAAIGAGVEMKSADAKARGR